MTSQRLASQREAAADLAVASLARNLSLVEEGRYLEFGPLPEDSVLVSAGTALRLDRAARAAYLPEIGTASPDPVFNPSDAAEWSGNPAGSLRLLQPLLTDPRAARRGGALLRVARIHRMAGRWEESLSAYAQLATLGSILVEGLPAEAVARQSRLTIFEKLHRPEDERTEARVLAAGLAASRWPLTEAAFGFYLEEATRALQPESPPAIPVERLQLASALVQAWSGRHDGQSRKLIFSGGRAFLFLRVKTAADLTFLLLGPDWLERYWRAPLAANLSARGIGLGLAASQGPPVLGAPRGAATSVRFAAATGLPWNVEVVTLNAEAEMGAARLRERIMGISLLTFALLVIVGTVVIVRSVTRELAISRLQSDFVAAVSHEFRTPLTSLCQISELFVQGRVPSQEDRALYDRILARESRRLRRLVEGLLDFGRMEAGAREYRFERIDISALARDVAREFNQENDTHAVRLHVDCQPAGDVQADRTAIACVIWNLLDNAMKYSGEQSPVRLSTRHDGGRVVVTVEDEGPGIPPAEQSRIFEKFVRGEAARAANIRGSGIGLALVKRILDAHRGEITLQSEPGRGCSFTFALGE
ncbi:MAG: GHKL domain-containing protein, partial [Acidobacteria bacterium]|nr:GHKL domain-containing protein [Acidobacteriota bacterium]